jgi:hypothetical protein
MRAKRIVNAPRQRGSFRGIGAGRDRANAATQRWGLAFVDHHNTCEFTLLEHHSNFFITLFPVLAADHDNPSYRRLSSLYSPAEFGAPACCSKRRYAGIFLHLHHFTTHTSVRTIIAPFRPPAVMAALPAVNVEDIINNVFLPPQLPQSADAIPSDSDTRMLELTSAALKEFSRGLPAVAHRAAVDGLAEAFISSRGVYGLINCISTDNLRKTLKALGDTDRLTHRLALHISAQNAGVIISRAGSVVTFEAFELSALNEKVMTTAGRLDRTFPRSTVLIDIETFRNADFLTTLSSTLAKMSIQAVPGMQPQSQKSDQKHDELRDSTHPGIVTELLFAGFLRALGASSSATTIVKHSREEVLWKNAKDPWKRSPMWLLIRVTMQLTLSRHGPDGIAIYKECMVFIHSAVLKQALAHSISSDRLSCMNAKIIRRLQKLSSQAAALRHTRRAIQDVLAESHRVLLQRMDASQGTKDLVLSGLASLDFNKDSFVSLPHLDEYILSLQARTPTDRTFSFTPTSRLMVYDSAQLPNLTNTPLLTDAEYGIHNLFGFEKWVRDNLTNWITRELSISTTGDQCAQLETLMKQYYAHATRMYGSNPEGLSTMFLILMELWIACDKAAVACCALLAEYHALVPYKILYNLLLPCKDQMERLRKVETYLATRCNDSLLPASTFFNCSHSNSFAARYYDSSPDHQKILSNIETIAAQQRRDKVAEFERLKAEYQRLMSLHSSAQCEQIEELTDPINNLWRPVHKPGCKKCLYSTQANALTISVHEWPLPSDGMKAKAVVFELQLPQWFAHWRDTLLFVNLDVLKGQYSAQHGRRASFSLSEHRQLSAQYLTGFSRRLDLLSEDKPYVVTHYGTKKIGTTNKDEVCGPNGCDYRYFDTGTDCFFGDCEFRGEPESMCTYKLSDHLASSQKYIFRPAKSPSGPDPNVVLANLHDCPHSMTLEEYRDLCTVPLGHLIQWQNMLEQVGMATVDFRKPETLLVFLQCINQAGPPHDTDISYLRESHQVLNDVSFATKLVHSLELALTRIKKNWESSNALRAFSAMSSCLLSMTDSQEIRKSCLVFLDRARFVAFDWLESLRHKAQQAVEQEDRTMFIEKATEIALVCGLTFDIDDAHLAKVIEVDANASVLWQCSMALREGKNAASSEVHHLLALRFQSILHRQHTAARLSFESGLNDAISKSWSAFTPGDSWRRSDYWMSTTTSGGNDNRSMTVHFNTLSGELLVDGVPVGGAPPEYEMQALFGTLFGHAAIEVMPTGVLGMRYSIKKTVQGNQVHMGMGLDPESQEELLVQSHAGDKTYETMPARLFRGHFPRFFVDRFVHWYDASLDEIHFRPIEQPWLSESPMIWRLARNSGTWQLTKNCSTLLAMNSASSNSMAEVFASLTVIDRIHCILAKELTVELHLPNVKLGFEIAPHTTTVRSREFRDMAVASSQSLGTLIGLESKLILTHGSTGSRSVILPQGAVSCTKVDPHVRVRVDPESIIKVHLLAVDECLGRLVDNGSLDCRLYIAYLHALTSFCLPSPLTHKTGTEDALSILQSAAVRSFDQLTQAQVDILALIARLTPGREYYPKHKQVMQTVKWNNNLGFLAQHPALQGNVKSIFAQWEQMKIFFPESTVRLPELPAIDSKLLHRDRIRTAMFRVSGFGAEYHNISEDAIYYSRDQVQASKRANDAFIMASRVKDESEFLHWDAPTSGLLWETVRRQNYILGPNHAIAWSKLCYDSEWTEDCEIWVHQNFAALHRVLHDKNACRAHAFDLMLWLSSMAWSDLDRPVLQLLQLLLTQGSKMPLSTFPSDTLQPCLGKGPTDDVLRKMIKAQKLPMHRCPEGQMTISTGQSQSDFSRKRQSAYDSNAHKSITRLVNALQGQWICEIPSETNIPDVSSYIDVAAVMIPVKTKFRTWHVNWTFSEYLRKVENAIARLSHQSSIVPAPVPMLTAIPTPSRRGYICVDDLFARFSPVMAQSPPALPQCIDSPMADYVHNSFPRLEALLRQLDASNNESKYETEYVQNLWSSKACLEAIGNGPLRPEVTLAVLNDHYESCRSHVSSLYEDLTMVVTHVTGRGQLYSGADAFEQWPRVCPMLFLEQLNHKHWHKLPSVWRSSIVKYALSLCALQHAQRMIAVAHSSVDLAKELQNTGHQNWLPEDHPDSLLMEVESGILIRDVQEDIASDMRSPPNGQNSVMQLNMGEGKSSVIVPMVAVSLADGKQLVRVVVAKPQSKQMAQMLISKLGGLLDRRVYYLPFSRSLKLDSAATQIVDTMVRKCMVERGVLLVQPEHLLSLKLMPPEGYITGQGEGSIGQSLMRTQDFFSQFSRDIVDESDENFSVKFELIYTMGQQGPIEMAPSRWTLLAEVLQLVRKLSPQVLARRPESMELHSRSPGCFPRLRFLNSEAADDMIQLVAEYICVSGLESFSIVARQPQVVRSAVLTYLTKIELDETEVAAVHNCGAWALLAESTKSSLLLLRGLLACGVLRFVFGQKRWRVNYGLANRTPPTKLAVPYRAKDNPSPRSEFSHPDVVIALTSLCYYYEGLCDADLFTALSHLAKSDQANSEYQTWVEDAPTLPSAFRQLTGINLQDRTQCIMALFPCLRFAKSAVDYFLAHVVFPKEIQEFKQKLSASGWDIGCVKNRPTTGFSGTNDSRALLPLDVHQLDLATQKHTNALVLNHLLQPVNTVEIMSSIDKSTSTDADQILATIMTLDPLPEVVLDVGAQILEDNQSVARAWLEMCGSDKDAAVYCNNEDELTVIDRYGGIEALQTSPYASRLDRTIIFLDEAHTRGIDLKLPPHYRAAVTLGAGLTKDRLVQACMRMRKLGYGQTVVFLVSDEIKTKIIECTAKATTQPITVTDVLHWSIGEQYKEARKSMPLWATQGQRFIKQSKIWSEAFVNEATVLTKEIAEKFLEDEAQSLQDRYQPRLGQIDTVLTQLDADDDSRSHAIADRCREFDELQYNSSTLQEEQERELSPETEQEREVQRPHPAEPAAHEVHAEIIAFARQGTLRKKSVKIMQAFQALRGTSAAKDFEVDQLIGSNNILVSADFARTVVVSSIDKQLMSDSYQRPVRYVLSRFASGKIDTLLIISPVEACAVLKHVAKSRNTAMHLYKPRCNMAYDPQDALDFYTTLGQTKCPELPRHMAAQLNVFAGQLYFSSSEDYLETCSFLGLSTEAAKDGWEIASDGFIVKDGRGRKGGQSGLSKSPVEFVKVLMSKIRRNGEGIGKTHMGRLLEGQLLTREDFVVQESEEV